MRRYATYALCAAITAGVAPARAQSIPEGQSCGGLLCDMGVFGHKTAPRATNEAAPAPKSAPAVPVADATPPREIAPEPIKPRPKKAVVRPKRVARAIVASVPAVSAQKTKSPVARTSALAPKTAVAPTSASGPVAPGLVVPGPVAQKPKVVANAPASTAVPAAVSTPIAQPLPPALQFRPLYNF